MNTNQETKNGKKAAVIVALCCAAILIAACAFIFIFLRSNGNSGTKNITVEVIVPDTDTVSFELKTKSDNLRDALEEADLIKGTESEYGLFITSVNNITADESKQEWWCVTKGGASVDTGVDSTMISDGDTYELTLKTGW